MYYTLCLALCLAVMFLVYSAALLISIPAAALARKILRQTRPQTQAGALFLLRMAPLLLGLTVSLGLALPSFLRFEPPGMNEGIGPAVLALALLGAAVLALIAVRLVRMVHATNNMERRWVAQADHIEVPGVTVPVYRINEAEALLAVTGMLRPQIFVSGDVARALTQEELGAALDHELAHVRHFDNLRQILLKSMHLPLGPLRSADADWARTSEVAADESAVRAGTSVLELSSALIKVGRLRGKLLSPRLAASHLAPAGCGVSTGERAAHLSTLLERGSFSAAPGSRAKKMVAGFGLAVAYFICLATLLPAVHEALELLVR